MTSPRKQPQPLQVFFTAYQPTQAELRQILEDAAEEAERLLPKILEKHGHTTSGKLKASQILLVLREVRTLHSSLWGDIGRVVRQGISNVTLAAAANAAEDFVLKYLRTHGADTEIIRAGIQAQARKGLQAALAKTANNVPLSMAVYRAQAWSNNLLQRRIRSALVLGRSARDLAKDVRNLISPNTPGGVAYAAFRLARTELNNAFHTETIKRQEAKPWNIGMEWHLSRSHPSTDACDLLVGRYPQGATPAKPHPQCFCYVTPVQLDEDTWIHNFLNGTYDDYFADLGYPQVAELPVRNRQANARAAARRRRRNR